MSVNFAVFYLTTHRVDSDSAINYLLLVLVCQFESQSVAGENTLFLAAVPIGRGASLGDTHTKAINATILIVGIQEKCIWFALIAALTSDQILAMTVATRLFGSSHQVIVRLLSDDVIGYPARFQVAILSPVISIITFLKAHYLAGAVVGGEDSVLLVLEDWIQPKTACVQACLLQLPVLLQDRVSGNRSTVCLFYYMLMMCRCRSLLYI